jgi:antitoxin component of MazEF toxin-antitoxin module
MEKINSIVKKWGNSYGIILPMEIIKNEDIKEGTKIEVIITSKGKTKVGDIFGILKGKIKRDTSDLLKEVDRDFENE